MHNFVKYLTVIEESWKDTVKQYNLTDGKKEWIEKIMEPVGTMKYAPWFTKVTTPTFSDALDYEHDLVVGLPVSSLDDKLSYFFSLFKKYDDQHHKDINTFKDITELLDFLVPYVEKEEGKGLEKIFQQEGSELIFQNKWFDIHLIKTHEASQKLGMKGVWCTAMDKSNYFNQYCFQDNTTFLYLVFKDKSDIAINEGIRQYIPDFYFVDAKLLFQKIAIQIDDNSLLQNSEREPQDIGKVTVFETWNALNEKDQPDSLVKFIYEMLQEEGDKIYPPVIDYLKSGEKSATGKSKLYKLLKMYLNKKITFKLIKKHLEDIFKELDVDGELSATPHGLELSFENKYNIPDFIYSNLFQHNMNLNVLSSLVKGDLTVFDYLDKDFEKHIDSQTIADITTYKQTHLEQNKLRKLMNSKPLRNSIKYYDSSGQVSNPTDFDLNVTLARNGSNKLLKDATSGGAAYITGLAIEHDILTKIDKGLNKLFSDNDYTIKVGWKTVVDYMDEHEYVNNPIHSILRQEIINLIDNIGQIKISNIKDAKYIQYISTLYAEWFNNPIDLICKGENLIGIREDHNLDEWQYWIDEWEGDFAVYIQFADESTEYWKNATFKDEEIATEKAKKLAFTGDEMDNVESVSAYNINKIGVLNIDTNNVNWIWEAPELVNDEEPESDISLDTVWWYTFSRAGWGFKYPSRVGSWTDLFIKFLHQSSGNMTRQAFFEWLGRTYNRNNMVDFFTSIKDAGIVKVTRGPGGAYIYSLGPNYEKWTHNKLKHLTDRDNWRPQAMNSLKSNLSTTEEKWATEEELLANKTQVESFSNFLENVPTVQQRGGADNQYLNLLWQGLESDTDEDEEDEDEEDLMLRGEPSVRSGSVFAYGGPLPPS